MEAPSFRVDIEREADLIEEIARFYGYDRIPSEVTPLRSFEPPANRKRERLQRIRQVLLQQGFDEVVNFSFSDPEKETAVGSGRTPIPIRNPISSRSALMRTNLLMGLLENASWNLNRGLEGVHIFERGNVYFLEDEEHTEQLTLGLVGTGRWGRPIGSPKTGDRIFRPQGRGRSPDVRPAVRPLLLRGGRASLLRGSGRSPWSTRARRSACRRPEEGDRRRVFPGRGSLCGRNQPPGLMAKQPRPFQYVPVPKFPGVSRDLSFLVDRGSPSRTSRKRWPAWGSPSWRVSN